MAGDGAKAYRQHYRQVSEDQRGDNVNLSPIDGEIAMRMRTTGHTQAEVEQIIAQCAQALRETAEGRNWDSYGQQVAESAFGTMGDRQMPRLEAQRKQLLELKKTSSLPPTNGQVMSDPLLPIDNMYTGNAFQPVT